MLFICLPCVESSAQSIGDMLAEGVANASATLFNSYGIPVSPFRSDDCN